MVYFILLVSLTVAQEEKHPQIWQSNVRNFPDYSQQVLRATYPVFNQPTIVAPTPRRAVPAAMYAYRSGLSSQYDIEHFQPPSPVRKPSRPPASRPSSQSTRPPSISCPALSFYPQHMQSILMSPSLTQLPLMSEVPPTLPPCLHTATLPLNAKRRDPGFTHLPAVGNTVRPSNGFSHTRPKPTGPRSQSNSREWYRPEPLNLKYPFGDGT